MLQRFIFVLTFCFSFTITFSQDDTLVKSDNLKDVKQKEVVKDTTKKHSVGKAALFSAVLPGLGQAYNKKWWKIPIVYAALGASGYFMISNQIKQKEAKRQINNRIDDPNYQFEGEYAGLDSLGVLTLQREYQNSRDLFIFITAGCYLLNILELSYIQEKGMHPTRSIHYKY